MPGHGNTPAPEASRRLGISLALSVASHLVVLFWPHWPLRNIASVAPPHQAGALTVRLVIPGPGTTPTADDFYLPEQASPADAANIGSQLAGQGSDVARVPKEIYELDEIDVRPWIRVRIMPEYPPTLPPGIEATTVLSFVVDELGRIGEIEVVSPAPDPLFDLFAIRAFSNASYTQALVNRKPVKVRMQVAVKFNSPPPP